MNISSHTRPSPAGRSRALASCSLILALGACPAAYAVTPGVATPGSPPTAGAQIRILQEETKQQLRQSTEEAPKVSVPASTRQKEAAAASDARIHVEAFVVSGVTRFTDEEVTSVLQPFTGRDLDTAGLHEAADALGRRYRQAGWFAARVFVPPQGSSGTVRLDVYEGYLEPGGIEVQNGSSHISTEAVMRILEAHLTSGQPMHRVAFERALLLIEDLPGVTIASTLYPGAAVGTARLRVVVSDQPAFAGNVDFDNFGNKFTGSERIGTTLYFNSPAGVGDQVVARLVTSGSQSGYAYLTYLRPASPNGMRVGASIDAFRYRTDEYVELGKASGEASDLRFFAVYPVIRGRHKNVNARADAFGLRLDDRNDVGVDSSRRIRGLALTVAGDEDEDWVGNGVTTYEFSVTGGRADVRGNDAFRAIDSATARVDGSFARANFTGMRLQHLAGPWSLLGRLSGQAASRNLDGSQKFYLGGAMTVSGYPVGEAGGDRGLDLHVELRRDFKVVWGGLMQAGVFYQQGWLQLHKSTWDGWQGRFPDLENRITLKSAGLALSQNWGAKWVARAHVGWQVGDNPLQDPRTGADSDGRSSPYRAWIQAIRYF
jgi:hemolysin activation/secretion protein